MKSQRQLQIGENIKRIMSEIFLREDYSVILNNVITILQADVSPDAKNVKIFIDIFGDNSKHKQIFEKISAHTPHFRHLLAQKIDLRNIPEIVFVHDKNIQKAHEIHSLIEDEASKINNNPQVKPKSRRKK